MNVDDINQKVQTAVGLAWPAFAADHPALAAVLDQEVVSEHVTDSLTSDPSFQKAYAAAVIAGTEAEVGAALIRELVGRVMARMG